MTSSQPISARYVVPVFDANRLRLAREARGLKQNELARLLGVQPAALSQFEHERARPSASTLTALALALHFPVTFFGRTEEREVPHSFFRSLRSTTVIDRKQAEATAELFFQLTLALERYVQLPKVDLPSVPLSGHVTPADAAREVRRRWQVPSGPIKNVVRLLEQHGIVVARTLRGSEKVDAFSRHFTPRPVVVLAADKKDRARSRFDAAHELGHLVIHSYEIGAIKEVEDQAHAFAAEFLMPADEIRAQLPVRLDWDRLVKMKFIWGTSVKALLTRAAQLGVMHEGSYVRAMKIYSSRGWRRGEPGDLGPPEMPRLLQKAVELIHEAGITSLQLATEAKLSIAEVERLLGEAGDVRPQVSLGDEIFSSRVTSIPRESSAGMPKRREPR